MVVGHRGCGHEAAELGLTRQASGGDAMQAVAVAKAGNESIRGRKRCCLRRHRRTFWFGNALAEPVYDKHGVSGGGDWAASLPTWPADGSRRLGVVDWLHRRHGSVGNTLGNGVKHGYEGGNKDVTNEAPTEARRGSIHPASKRLQPGEPMISRSLSASHQVYPAAIRAACCKLLNKAHHTRLITV